MLSPFWRKLVLTLHVVTSVGFIGAVGTFLTLAVAGLRGEAWAYEALPPITWWVIVPLAIASLAVGLASSLGTPWGLVRHYWLATKLILTLFALIVLLLQTRTIGMLARMAASGSIGPATLEGQAAMVIHSVGGLVVLLAMAALSIFKPRGATGLRV